jgi:hypothetical protein
MVFLPTSWLAWLCPKSWLQLTSLRFYCISVLRCNSSCSSFELRNVSSYERTAKKIPIFTSSVPFSCASPWICVLTQALPKNFRIGPPTILPQKNIFLNMLQYISRVCINTDVPRRKSSVYTSELKRAKIKTNFIIKFLVVNRHRFPWRCNFHRENIMFHVMWCQSCICII